MAAFEPQRGDEVTPAEEVGLETEGDDAVDVGFATRPASAIALSEASAARLATVVPDFAVKAVWPIPAIAVLSEIACRIGLV